MNTLRTFYGHGLVFSIVVSSSVRIMRTCVRLEKLICKLRKILAHVVDAVVIWILSACLILKENIEKVFSKVGVCIQVQWPSWEDYVDGIHVL